MFSAAISYNIVSCYVAPGEKTFKIISLLRFLQVIDRIHATQKCLYVHMYT